MRHNIPFRLRIQKKKKKKIDYRKKLFKKLIPRILEYFIMNTFKIFLQIAVETKKSKNKKFIS